jgi:hypothetical protein
MTTLGKDYSGYNGVVQKGVTMNVQENVRIKLKDYNTEIEHKRSSFSLSLLPSLIHTYILKFNHLNP